MVNFSNRVNGVAKQLNTIARNKTLKEFAVLCSVSAATFFAGLAVVLLRAEPLEEPITIDESINVEALPQDATDE